MLTCLIMSCLVSFFFKNRPRFGLNSRCLKKKRPCTLRTFAGHKRQGFHSTYDSPTYFYIRCVHGTRHLHLFPSKQADSIPHCLQVSSFHHTNEPSRTLGPFQTNRIENSNPNAIQSNRNQKRKL